MPLKGISLWLLMPLLLRLFFDLLDGRVARLTNATSKFGAQYDSLSDLVSFCMAPSLLLFLWSLRPFGRIGWLASFFLCGMWGSSSSLDLMYKRRLQILPIFKGYPLPWPQVLWPVLSLRLRTYSLSLKGLGAFFR